MNLKLFFRPALTTLARMQKRSSAKAHHFQSVLDFCAQSAELHLEATIAWLKNDIHFKQIDVATNFILFFKYIPYFS
jgi:hypothetical protein